MNIGLEQGILIITTVGGWIAFFVAIKHQALSNARSIETIEKRLDEKKERIGKLEDKASRLLQIDVADEKFVTKRELELTLKSIELKLDIVIKNQEGLVKGLRNSKKPSLH